VGATELSCDAIMVACGFQTSIVRLRVILLMVDYWHWVGAFVACGLVSETGFNVMLNKVLSIEHTPE
jgi:hypothetical protein